MPILNGIIDDRGPVVELLIGVGDERRQALERQNFPVPARVRILAQLDTGAGITAIDGQVLKKLGLRPVGERLVHTPSTGSTPHRAEEYSVSVTFPHPEIETYLPVILCIGVILDQGDGVQTLLGRDALNQCLFVYNGPEGTFSLAY